MTTEAPRDRSTAKILGTVIALGAIGVGGYLIYDFIKKKSCSPLGATKCIDGYQNECSPWPSEDIKLLSYWKKTGEFCQEGCTNGDTRCYNNQSQVCQGGVWVPGGDACDGGGETPVLCIDGATRCQGADKIQCQDREWKVIGGCSAADCRGITCVPSQVACDEDDTLYYESACNPVLNRCNYTMYVPNAIQCRNAGVASIAIDVNGYETYYQSLMQPVYIQATQRCGDPATWFSRDLARFPDLFFHIVVSDSYGRKIEGANIEIKNLAEKSALGFPDPAYFDSEDWDNMPVTCGSFLYGTATNSNGEAWVRGLVMYNPSQGTQHNELFYVDVTYKGVTVRKKISLVIVGSGYGDNDESCHGAWIDASLCRLDR